MGYQRIVGELKGFRMVVSATTVRTWLRAAGLGRPAGARDDLALPDSRPARNSPTVLMTSFGAVGSRSFAHHSRAQANAWPSGSCAPFGQMSRSAAAITNPKIAGRIATRADYPEVAFKSPRRKPTDGRRKPLRTGGRGQQPASRGFRTKALTAMPAGTCDPTTSGCSKLR